MFYVGDYVLLENHVLLGAHHHEGCLKRCSSAWESDPAQTAVLQNEITLFRFLADPLEEVVHLLFSAHQLSRVVRPCPGIGMVDGIVGGGDAIVSCAIITAKVDDVGTVSGAGFSDAVLRVQHDRQHAKEAFAFIQGVFLSPSFLHWG